MLSDNQSQLARARSVLPWLKMDASALLGKWPSKPGRLPFSGKFWAEGADSEMILVTEELFEALDELFQTGSTSRNLGPFIWKIDGGGVRFDFDTTEVKIEFHPLGKQPSSFRTAVRLSSELGGFRGKFDHVMERFVELETQWFLVWYSVGDVDEESPA